MSLSTKTKLLDIQKQNGVVYTPYSLASYVGEKLIELYLNDPDHLVAKNNLQELKIIDPACGEGELLLALWRALFSRDNKLSSPKSILCGVDIDAESISKTAKKVEQLNPLHALVDRYNFLSTNALIPKNKEHNINGWDSLNKLFGATEGFDLLIANPPWGADTSSYEKNLNGFTLNKGQYDSSDLFVELAISLVKPGGYFAFIIPDSLFGFERKELRKMLLKETEIKFIGRLGEKIFEGINRACVVLICKKTQATEQSLVNCMRLDSELRKSILDGKVSYDFAEKKLAYTVKQSRFSSNPELLFDIDTKEEEMRVLGKISGTNEIIGEYVVSARGVELSKTGKIYKCSNCDYWAPLPTTQKSKCNHCDSLIDLTKVQLRTIISKKKFKGSRPILVGESVRRYSISSRFWIAVDNKGINYKSISLYYEPKILVRKTGVGITATIDYSNALTNQVVYMFKPRPGAKSIIQIEFILAVMNSRAIYYHLLKKYGEIEWRSHPYLTQSQVLGLPLPNLSSGEAKLTQKKIVGLLKPYLEKKLSISKTVDAKVEFLVASMFGLTKTDYELIYKTLNSTQGLIPVKELSAVGVTDIFK